MARIDKAPGRTGPVIRVPSIGARFGRKGRSPRPGGRPGPVRSGRR